MNENTFLIFTGIHPSLSLFQENIETEVMDSWWRVVKRLFSFLLLVQHFTITLLNDQDYSPDGRLIVNVISEEDQEKPSLTSHQQMASLKLSSRKGSSDRVILFLLQMIAHIKEKKRMGDRKRKKKWNLAGSKKTWSHCGRSYQLRLMAHNSRFL